LRDSRIRESNKFVSSAIEYYCYAWEAHMDRLYETYTKL